MLENSISRYAAFNNFRMKTLNKGPVIPHMKLTDPKTKVSLVFKGGALISLDLFIFVPDFRALQAQDMNLDHCISTWIPKYCLLCLRNNKIIMCNRGHAVHDIVGKIKFPHGLFNTVGELASAKEFPADKSLWPIAFGDPPSDVEIRESKLVFDENEYSNLYRYFGFGFL